MSFHWCTLIPMLIFGFLQSYMADGRGVDLSSTLVASQCQLRVCCVHRWVFKGIFKWVNIINIRHLEQIKNCESDCSNILTFRCTKTSQAYAMILLLLTQILRMYSKMIEVDKKCKKWSGRKWNSIRYKQFILHNYADVPVILVNKLISRNIQSVKLEYLTFLTWW